MSLRIHIAEDEPRSARLLMQLLEIQWGSGLIFDWSKTVNEAINLLKINPPHLLILDMELSGRSGFDVLDATLNRTFPVIIASARKEHAYNCFRYGVLAYILKPIDPAELSEAISRCERFLPLAH